MSVRIQPFTIFTGLVAPIDRADVDTDAMVPKQYLRSSASAGFGDILFDSWRYLDPGDVGVDVRTRRINPAFVLNQPRYQGARILLARATFGCGSSREHAVWALRDYGIRAYIAPAFGEIFFNNSLKNGLLPVVLPENQVAELFRQVHGAPGYALTIDLVGERVRLPDGRAMPFSIDKFRRRCLLEGLDDIAFALTRAKQIRDFEKQRARDVPWLQLRQASQ